MATASALCDIIRRMPGAQIGSTILEAETQFSENFKNFNLDMPCALGIDEAGRGPVLGPMVYACVIIPTDKDNMLKNMGADDSKTLTEAKREEIFQKMNEFSASKMVAYACRILSAQMISAAMLRRTKCSLNELSQNSAAELLKSALNNNIKVVEAYIDTVGPKGPYQLMLQKKFPDIQVVVSEKADSKFPVVGAASIVAKVKRDRILKDWVFPEGNINVPDDGYGSGYPGDPNTKNFLLKTIDPVFGYPNLVRFSWKTAEILLEQKAVKCKWENPEFGSTGTITSYFRPCPSGEKYAPPKSRFFADRCLSNITKCSDF